jgi:biopolymer transport protein ExbD
MVGTMKRKSVIELTPLLDIILILLFAFLINTQNTHANEINTFKEQMENEKERNRSEIAVLSLKIKNLQNVDEDNKCLNEEIEALNEKLNWEQEKSINQANDLQEAVKAVTEMLSLYEYQWKTAANNEIDAVKALQEISDERNALLRLYQFEKLMKRFYILDIELKGENNQLVINGEGKTVYITKEEINSDELQRKKTNEVNDLLDGILLGREGGDEMVLATLIVRDKEVYHYAHTFMSDIMRNFKNRHINTKIYTYQFTSYWKGD